MWPETQAWIWLSIALLAVVLWALWRWNTYRKANAYRRAALAELEGVGDDPVAVASILRRTALVAYPRSKVANLAGDKWLAFLDARTSENAFATEMGREMTSAPYRGNTNPVVGINDCAGDWIRQHKQWEPA